VIHPESPLKAYWEAAVLLTAVASAIVLPTTEVCAAGVTLLADWVRAAAVVVYAVDMLVAFATGIKSRGNVVMDRREVAARYLATWFWADLAAIVPFGSLMSLAGLGSTTAARVLGLAPLIKLPSAARAFRRADAVGANPAIVRLSVLVFWILLAMHGISLGWMVVRGDREGLDPGSRYLRAFYWTITTVATIGYGDIVPEGNEQTLYVIAVEVVGASMYAMVIANLASLIANVDAGRAAHRERLDRVNAFLKLRRVPSELNRRINDYYNYLWDTRRGFDESSVLRELPDPLRLSVSLHLNKEMIEKVPLFEKAGDALIRDIIMNLTPVVFTPGDTVVRAGEPGFDMYFISKGSVEVVSPDGASVFVTLTEGHFFGEIALLLSTPRTATVRTREYCDLYRLDKTTFDRVITHYPAFAETIRDLADKRRSELEASSRA
jgi:hypothetical protein